MPKHRIVVAAVAALTVVLLLSSSIDGMTDPHSAPSDRAAEQNDGICMATAHCAPAPDCLSHCSTLMNEDSSTPLALAVTSARTGIVPPTLQAVAVDLQKPPPRIV